MTSEQLAVLLMIIAIFLILAELLWLYVISQKQEEYLRKKEKNRKVAKTQIEAVLNSPIENIRENEIKNFLDTAYKNNANLIATVSVLIDFQNKRERLSNERQKILDNLYDRFQPTDELQKILKSGNKYERACICRLLADLDAKDAIEDIRECLKGKNVTLQYNAGMALSTLGDEDGVYDFINICENNQKFSHRIVVELLNNYSGDKLALVKRYFGKDEEKDEYMQATIIKAIKNDRFSELQDIFIKNFEGKSHQLRVASTKAMSEIGSPIFEQYLITASMDKDWVIRLSSLTGLEKINSPKTFDAIKRITGDEQWWVRKRAAEALVRMDQSMEKIEEVINGYDRYAADAVIESLYKSL